MYGWQITQITKVRNFIENLLPSSQNLTLAEFSKPQPIPMNSISPAKTGILLEQTGHKGRSPRKLNHHYKSRLTAKTESSVLELYWPFPTNPQRVSAKQAMGITDTFPLSKPRTTCTEEQDGKSFESSAVDLAGRKRACTRSPCCSGREKESWRGSWRVLGERRVEMDETMWNIGFLVSLIQVNLSLQFRDGD